MTRQVNTHQLMCKLLKIQQWEFGRAWCEDSDDLSRIEQELEQAQRELAELLLGGAECQVDLPAIVFAPALTQPAPGGE